MTKRGIPIGPFEIFRPIGKGGMAEVWEGRHRRQGVPVAVKVITAKQALNEQFLKAFRNEVRSVAELDHPAIVMVFDHGKIEAKAERLSQGRLVAGSPYLAMELATGGSLFHVRDPFSWDQLRRVLRTLLDALAHAHARGVIHRDIKPGNVLMAGPRDTRPGIKLTDFGLATALRLHGKTEGMGHTAGTPQYMAPEQFEGRWRDFGPWTDLYALGCVAFELASGVRPFDGEGFWDIHKSHTEGPPPFESRLPVPTDFVSWLSRLLAWKPKDRFQTCADAALALQNLQEPVIPDPQPTWDKRPGSAELVRAIPLKENTPNPNATTARRNQEAQSHEGTLAVLSQSQGEIHSQTLFGAPEPTPRLENTAVDLERVSPIPAAPPPLADNWRRPGDGRVSMQLIGAGLGLYGLRSVPLVGREQERNQIWSALSEVHQEHNARLVFLHGAEGVGKSRLIGWVCERAHELGGALILHARHHAMGSPGEGLAGMVRRALRCVNMPREELVERCRVILKDQHCNDEYEWLALAELLQPEETSEDGKKRVHFTNSMQRFVLVRRLLERMALQRPLILWLDDLQWGSDTLAFAEYMIKVQKLAASPILMIASAQEEALNGNPEFRTRVQEILSRKHTQEIHLKPLSSSERSELVEHLLCLSGELAHQVIERTDGNPMFATQLVGDWVHRGILEVGEHGFVLKEGANAQIPDDIHQLWSERITRFVAQKPRETILAMELASALGQQIHHGELQAAAREARFQIPPTLQYDLISNQLAVIQDGGWSFAHNMLRESLERRAREELRWRAHHHACAAMLRRVYRKNLRSIAERLGRHLLEAGQTKEALVPLMEGAEHRASRSEFNATMELITLYRSALKDLKTPEDNVRWGKATLQQIQCYNEQSRSQEAELLALDVEQKATLHGWTSLLPETFRLRAHVLRKRGDLAGAAKMFQEARQGFQDTGEHLRVAGCTRGLGYVYSEMGELDLAETTCQQALRTFTALRYTLGIADTSQCLAVVERKRDNFQTAGQHARHALHLYEQMGYLLGQANCHNTLAEIARYQNDLEGAEYGYRKASSFHAAVGGDGAIPRLNLGLVLIGRGRYAEALHELEKVMVQTRAQGRHALTGAVHTVMLPCNAWMRDWRSWDYNFTSAQQILQKTQMIDPDLAWPAQLSGELLKQTQQHDRARLSYEFAKQQWLALQKPDKAAQIERSLVQIH